MKDKLKNIFNFTNTMTLLFLITIMFILYSNNNKQIVLDTGSEVVTDEHISGNVNNEDITLYEYGDLQCPSCAGFESVVKDRLAENPDIRFVFRHFPLDIHINAFPAAVVSEAAARQGKFWEMKSTLFNNQSKWGNSLNSEKEFLVYAKELGLDMDMFSKDINDTELEKRIRRDMNSGARAGITGTPTFFLNGQKLDNSIVADKDAFAKAIQEAGNNK